jgi:hypothetical protein
MTYEFRPRTVRDYDGATLGLDHTQRAMKCWACLKAMEIFERDLGTGSKLYAEFQARAISWASA